MDLLKVNPISYYKYLIIGDTIIDFYIEEKETFLIRGGALNVYENIKKITSENVNFIFPNKFKCLNLFKHNKKYSSFTNSNETIQAEISFCKVATISDYDKGFLNNSYKIHSKILIVDSKYCSLKKDYIIHSKIKILKLASTDVFKNDFINLFDYLIVTHSTHINLFFKNELIKSFDAPSIKGLCTIGAGDVFTATLSVELYPFYKKFKLFHLVSAIEKAVLNASYSVAAPFTSRIKEIK